MYCRTLGFPVFHYLLDFAQTHVHWVNDAIQPSHPLLPISPFTFNLAQHQGFFQWVSSLQQVAKVLQFQFQQQSFQWIFRIDFLQDSLVWSPCCPRDSQESSPAPQVESINSSALSLLYGPSLLFVQTTALTIWTFVDKVMSLLFNMLSRFIIAFLPRSKHLLIPWLQSLSAVILEPKKVKSLLVSIVSHLCHEVMGPDVMILVFLMLSFKPAFSTLFFHFRQEASSLSAIMVVYLQIWDYR